MSVSGEAPLMKGDLTLLLSFNRDRELPHSRSFYMRKKGGDKPYSTAVMTYDKGRRHPIEFAALTKRKIASTSVTSCRQSYRLRPAPGPEKPDTCRGRDYHDCRYDGPAPRRNRDWYIHHLPSRVRSTHTLHSRHVVHARMRFLSRCHFSDHQRRLRGDIAVGSDGDDSVLARLAVRWNRDDLLERTLRTRLNAAEDNLLQNAAQLEANRRIMRKLCPEDCYRQARRGLFGAQRNSAGAMSERATEREHC